GNHDIGPPQVRSTAVESIVARRTGLDCDEGDGEGPQPEIRGGQFVCRGCAAVPGRRDGAGTRAVGELSIPEIRTAEWCRPGDRGTDCIAHHGKYHRSRDD